MGGTVGRAITYFQGAWLEGNPKVIGPMTHAFWLSSVVFDGARAFEGVAPDLDRHCARCVRSAVAMGLAPPISAGEIETLAREAVARFPSGSTLYIRPMFYAESGFVGPDPGSTQFMLTVYESPLPGIEGFSACLSTRTRPSPTSAPTDAKASCLYPNAGRALREAAARGFDNAVMLDPAGLVAEFATANLFLAKDGVVHTPSCNGTFLDGITRQRVIGLLRADGVAVVERSVGFDEVLAADEVFSTGNYAKVVPATRIEDRRWDPGPLFARARSLYWEFAHR